MIRRGARAADGGRDKLSDNEGAEIEEELVKRSLRFDEWVEKKEKMKNEQQVIMKIQICTYLTHVGCVSFGSGVLECEALGLSVASM